MNIWMKIGIMRLTTLIPVKYNYANKKLTVSNKNQAKKFFKSM